MLNSIFSKVVFTVKIYFSHHNFCVLLLVKPNLIVLNFFFKDNFVFNRFKLFFKDKFVFQSINSFNFTESRSKEYEIQSCRFFTLIYYITSGYMQNMSFVSIKVLTYESLLSVWNVCLGETGPICTSPRRCQRSAGASVV